MASLIAWVELGQSINCLKHVVSHFPAFVVVFPEFAFRLDKLQNRIQLEKHRRSQPEFEHRRGVVDFRIAWHFL